MKNLKKLFNFFSKNSKEKYIPILKVKTVDFYKSLSTKERLKLYFEEVTLVKKTTNFKEINKLTKSSCSNFYPILKDNKL